MEIEATDIAARLLHLIEQRDVAGPSDDDVVASLAKRVRQGEQLPKGQLDELAHRIRVERPVLHVVDGQIESLPTQAGVAFPDWPQFAAKLAALLPAIARLDHKGDPAATAFPVGANLLMTNRHVPDDLELPAGGDAADLCAVFAGSETGTPVKLQLAEVVALDDAADLALLRSAKRPPAPALSPGHGAVHEGDAIAVAGYPEPDGWGDFARVFGGQTASLCVSPGRVVKLGAGTFFHDCTTLGGNSGSPVFSIKTAELIGVQAEGHFLLANSAVSAEAVAAFLEGAGRSET
jgi:endonuclease G